MNNASPGMGPDMFECMGGMMWGMGILGVLGAILLILGIAALVKYLIVEKRQ
ncbi:MAG: hypothetical protein ACFE0S_13480 [Rhodospirillales bacterium]